MPKTLRLPPDAEGLREAGRMLAAGSLVAFPTETVYGLGCDATNPEAVAKLYAAKGRPSFNPLIAHIGDFEEAESLAVFDDAARLLARRFWPGPLTLVLPMREGGAVCELARAGLASIAVRMPSHPIAQALIAAAGVPIAAPSANRSGHVSPTSAAHVLADLDGLIDAVLMGEDAPEGLESTIIAISGARAHMLRPGALPRYVIEAALGARLEGLAERGRVPVAPGQLASHYATKARLRLNAASRAAGEGAIDFAEQLDDGLPGRIDLSPKGDMTEAASHLYAALRSIDAIGFASIAVAPIPSSGLGEAINDRLARAAAPRAAT
jgi:L-threonylcarbamoyladenylate synthase